MQFTLFTIPRGFVGTPGVRQHNAIDTWLQLEPRPEVLLFGDEEDIGLVAKQCKLVHIPEIELSPQGVPLVSSAFQLAQQSASHDIMCYVNADIMLFQSFAAALAQVAKRFEQFLMIGRRTDLDFDARLEINEKDWQRKLTLLAKTQGRLHGVDGIDYFAFRRGLYKKVPPFAVGRYAWDNWLVYDVLKRNDIPVVDVSQKVLVIHQEHEHWPKSGDDFRRNSALYKRDYSAGGGGNKISNAIWILDGKGLRKK